MSILDFFKSSEEKDVEAMRRIYDRAMDDRFMNDPSVRGIINNYLTRDGKTWGTEIKKSDDKTA